MWTPAILLLITLTNANRVTISADSSTSEYDVPWAPRGGFTFDASQNVSAVRQKIFAMPFLQELVDGTLPQATFAFYLTQDSLYLRQYAKVLAALASRAPTIAITQTMAQAADWTLAYEQGTLTASYLSAIDISNAEPSPTGSGYIHFMQSRLAVAPYEVAFAAAVPCYTIYAEVGRHIQSLNVPLEDHPYSEWMSTYGGIEFERWTQRVTSALDEIAASASPSVREEMLAAFRQSTRFEWMFWDSAHRREAWPI